MNKYEAEARASRLRRLKERSCGTKRRFPTREQAAAHNSGQVAYACRYCGGWHLTGQLSRLLARARKTIIP